MKGNRDRNERIAQLAYRINEWQGRDDRVTPRLVRALVLTMANDPVLLLELNELTDELLTKYVESHANG